MKTMQTQMHDGITSNSKARFLEIVAKCVRIFCDHAI